MRFGKVCLNGSRPYKKKAIQNQFLSSQNEMAVRVIRADHCIGRNEVLARLKDPHIKIKDPPIHQNQRSIRPSYSD